MTTTCLFGLASQVSTLPVTASRHMKSRSRTLKLNPEWFQRLVPGQFLPVCNTVNQRGPLTGGLNSHKLSNY
jgi:hypothetical protein